MQVFAASAAYASSPRRATATAASGVFSGPGTMRSTAQLRSNYNLIGLEDSECVDKLLAILDGKDKEIEKLKRDVATKGYDDLWDQNRNRTFVPSTPKTPAPVPRRAMCMEAGTQTDPVNPDEDSFSSDGSADMATRIVEPLLPSTPPPPPHPDDPVSPPQPTSPLTPRSKRAAEKYLYPFRKAEQKLVLAMKTKISMLERKLAEAEAAAAAVREEEPSYVSYDRSAEEYHEELEAQARHIEALEAELADARREIEEVHQAEALAQSTNATLTQKLRSAESQLTMLEAAAETTAADIQALRDEVAVIPTLHTRIQLLETKLADTEAEYEAVGQADRAHLLALTSTIRDLEARLADAEQDVMTGKASYLKRVAAMRNKIAGLEARIKSNSENKAPAPVTTTPPRPAGDQKLLDLLKQKVRELQARLAQAESVNEAAAAANADLQAALREASRNAQTCETCDTGVQTDAQFPSQKTIIDLTDEQYDHLRTCLHALADDVQTSIMGGSPVITGPSRPATPSSDSHATQQRATPASSFALNPSAKAGPILSAFRSLNAVLAHLTDRCSASTESAQAARSDLRKAVGALKRARGDVLLAEQARSLVIARVKELDVQCATKMAKLKLLDELIETGENGTGKQPNGVVKSKPSSKKLQSLRAQDNEDDKENMRGDLKMGAAARSPRKGLRQQQQQDHQQEGIRWKMVA
ncbi:hypothetical protein BDZ88DRAFT_431735 [Geranomyces variabilis]|nr:hypothetical protein BDZ88DRAFT_431735 [Geranomyces variabilis]KAJ3131877.1 hypothetical protein HDU90_007706 [Geranomyces variabilis]